MSEKKVKETITFAIEGKENLLKSIKTNFDAGYDIEIISKRETYRNGRMVDFYSATYSKEEDNK